MQFCSKLLLHLVENRGYYRPYYYYYFLLHFLSIMMRKRRKDLLQRKRLRAFIYLRTETHSLVIEIVERFFLLKSRDEIERQTLIDS